MLARDMEKGVRYIYIVMLRTAINKIKMNCRAACKGNDVAAEKLTFKFLWKAVINYVPEMARLQVPLTQEDLNMNLMTLLHAEEEF